MNQNKQKIIFVASLIVIVLAIVLMYVRMKPPKVSGRRCMWTMYAIDESDDSVFFFGFNKPIRWPVTYKGRTLWPLWRCSECERTFIVYGPSEANVCPHCGSGETTHYPTSLADAIDAEQIDYDDLEMATSN